MKKVGIIIFLSFVLLSGACFSQEVRENINEVLNEQQRADWYKTRKAWENKYFHAFLKKNKIKLSCKKCASVYLDVHFSIMEDGHAHLKILQTQKCGSAFNEKQVSELEKLLFNLEFAPTLYNSKFLARLGNGLKC